MMYCPETVVSQEKYAAARQWFKEVDGALRALSLPYCSLGLASDEGLEMFENRCFTHINYLPLDEKEMIVSYLQKLQESKPPSEIFVKIKNDVAKKAVPEITEIYPDARSAIVFGDLLGDIDIALLIEKEDKREIRIDKEYTKLLGALKEKYPVMDIFALNHFRSNTGKELAEKLFAAHCTCYMEDGIYPFQKAVLSHLDSAFQNSWLLYGQQGDYDEFMKIYDEIIAPLRSLNLKTVGAVSLPIATQIARAISKFAEIKPPS